MNSSTKEKFDITAKTVGIIGGVLSAIALVITLQSSTEQRARELRWKQANLAMELVDTMLSDPQAFDALRMVDWNGREYKINDKGKTLIGTQDVISALDIDNNNNLSAKGVFVRESFDRLFYHMGRMERSVKTELIVFDDVRSPLGYYSQILCKEYNQVLTPYMIQLSVDDALKFLKRFKLNECISMPNIISKHKGPITNTILINEVAKETGLERKEIEESIETFLTNIKRDVIKSKGKRVLFTDLGVFYLRERAPRTVRNPKTGEEIEIPSKIDIIFRSSKTLDVKTDYKHDNNIIDVFSRKIKAHIIKSEGVILSNFGVFSTRIRNQRSGRNPGAGGNTDIQIKKKIEFEPDVTFKVMY